MTNDNDLFYRISMIMNVDPAEIDKIVHDYIERDIGCGTVYDRLNCPKPPIYIGPVKLMTLRDRIIEESTKELQNKVDKLILQKEEMGMKATSVQNIKNVKDVCFDISNNPIERESKLTIVASTNDDIFAFEFEGPHLVDVCRNAGLFTNWEKDQKIKELEKELEILKDEKIKEKNRKINDLYHQLHLVERDKERLAGGYKYLKTMNDEYSERINALQRMYNFEKAANEAQHKFFVNYAGKGTEIEFNYAIENVNEVSYVILDKDEYQNLKDNGYRAKIHDEIYTTDQLVDRVLELEEENNRLHDTAKEGDYVCLNSVPYSADDIKKLKEQIKKLEELKTPTIENFADEELVDNVNHPSHYTGRYECIDVMQDVFGDEATNDFCLCNAFKYIWRARKKNGLEDVKKAVWYLNKYIEEAKKDGVSKGERV